MKRLKQVISFILIATLILILPVRVNAEDNNGEVYSENIASEMDVPEVSDEEKAEEPDINSENNKMVTETNNLESSAIEYVYVENSDIVIGQKQNIVLALADEDVSLTEAYLTLQKEETGESFILDASTIVNNTILFEKTFEATEIGEIALKSFYFRSLDNESEYEVELSELQKTSFNVTEETNQISEVEEAIIPEVTAYAFDKAGDMVEASGNTAEQAIEEAMDAAGLQAESDNMSRSRGIDTKTKELVIALDPGHDSHCGGATANGLVEQELTLKIANYCKEELEQYSNVKVIMTRTGAECPNPISGDYSSGKDIIQRVDKAKQQGADVIVSFHLNSAGGASGINGAEIIYQNKSYNASISQVSEELAQKILDQLLALGLKGRGIYSKDADTTGGYKPQKDPNGLTEDYFTLHNEAKVAGMPAVLIEHAFLTGSSDSAFLKNELNLKRLGEADAAGIAKQYGLTKWIDGAAPTIGEIRFANINGPEGTFDIILKNIQGANGADKIEVAVWTKADGQDDLVWYTTGKQQDGTYKATINVKNHKNLYGIYCAHAYVTKNSGDKIFGIDSELEFRNAKISAVIDVKNNTNGKFDIIIKDIYAPNGIKKIEVPVWSEENGQDDIIWYAGEKQQDGTYKISVDTSNHDYSPGLYIAHAYLINTYDESFFLNSAEVKVKLPDVKVVAEDISNGRQNKYLIKASNVGYYNNVQSVDFAVWSAANGQDDIVWYSATQNTSGIWLAEADVYKHNSTGLFYVHAYVTMENGSKKLISNTEFSVQQDQGISIGQVEMINTGDGKFQIKVNDATGIGKILCPVWSEIDGQDDIIWYEMERQSDNTFVKTIDISDHKYSSGIYNAHFYITDIAGNITFAKAETFNVKLPTVEIVAKNTIAAESIFDISASNLGYYGTAKNLKFAIWSAENGQDDIVWYDAERTKTGTWKTIVNTTQHKSYGDFYVHTYITLSDGSQKFVGSIEFAAPKPHAPMAESIDFDMSNYNSQGVVGITVKGVKASTGIQQVKIPIWSETDGQDDLVWYDAKSGENGVYTAAFSMKDHKYSTGVYNVHVYIIDGTGGMTLAAAKWPKLQLPDLNVYAKVQNPTEGNIVELSVANVGFYGLVKNVQFAIWSEENGQNDLIWYTGSQNSSTGIWNTTIDVNNHDVSGMYNAHVYATLENGNRKLIGNTNFIGTKVYKIMGDPESTESQMVRFFKSKGYTYPAVALERGGAPTIEDFCHILYEEAVIEGVKAEVVFAQAMLETGYLKFGGDVKIEQYNFAGLGATGNGKPGNVFPDVRTGLRAQIQHLKCYASTQPLKQECADQRWSESLRGKATSVEALSGKWATNPQYGNNITKLIKEIKKNI